VEQLLERLFESVPKARILRMFMRNPEERFQLEEIASKSQVKKYTVRTELKKLLNIGLIRQSKIRIEIPQKKGKKARTREVAVYGVDQAFPLFSSLHDLVGKASVTSRMKLTRQMKSLGKVKLAVISGIFLSLENSRTDLLIVADGLQKSKLNRFLADLESELGKPIQHTIMETDEFQYRMDMYDRFLRDILEYPHEKVINKFNF